MTPIEYADKLRLQLAELQRDNRPLALAVTTTATEMASRIFIRGEASDGGSIGQYNDTSIMYLNPTNAKVFGRSKIGQPGNFENGKKRKTVKMTYKEYKAALGRPAGGAFVNLELTGDLKSDFTNTKGIQAAPEKVSNNEYTISLSEVNMNKAMGNESRFGKTIFKHTRKEIETFFRINEFELKKMFST